jgi:hypothetical protein
MKERGDNGLLDRSSGESRVFRLGFNVNGLAKFAFDDRSPVMLTSLDNVVLCGPGKFRQRIR